MTVRCVFEGRILSLILEDNYHLRDVQAALNQAILEPDFVGPMLLFVDARHSKANPPVAEIRQAADYFYSLKDHFLPDWVILVSSLLHYGLARMFGVFVEEYGIHLQVYRKLESAQREAQRLSG